MPLSPTEIDAIRREVRNDHLRSLLFSLVFITVPTVLIYLAFN